jgi:hypothetical protein
VHGCAVHYYGTDRPSSLTHATVGTRCRSADIPAVQTDTCDFAQHLDAALEECLKLGHDFLLPHSVQFVIHLLPDYSGH